MATNRDEILANFQACTGIDNFEECLAHLEQNDWNLHQAISSVLEAGEETSTAPPEIPPETQPTVVRSSTPPPAVPIPSYTSSAFAPRAASSYPSTSSSSTSSNVLPLSSPPTKIRMLNFIIEYKNNTLEYVVEDNRTVGVLKDLISQDLKIPIPGMKLGGWGHGRSFPFDEKVLSSLHLPLENKLYLLTDDCGSQEEKEDGGKTNGEEDLFSERLGQTYILEIQDSDEEHQYSLRYEGSKTIFDVKQGIFSLTNVPIRQQKWRGWTIDGDDTLTLAASGINFPKHCLSFSRIQPTPRPKPPRDVADAVSIDNSSDDEEYMDATETLDDSAMFLEEGNHRKFQTLIPIEIEDDADAIRHFSSEFSSRYGSSHPSFFMGSLEEAMKEAFNKAARDRKLLAVYIHHDSSIQGNVFCSQVLCADSIISFLTQHFVLWAWDVTEEINKARLFNAFTKQFGSVTMATVRNLPQDKFPALIIAMRLYSNTEVFSVLQGNTSLDVMMTTLLHAVDVFNERRLPEIAQEEERNAAEMLKQEQDLAYQVSLHADRAKAEEKEKLEREERQQKEKETEEKLMQEQENEAIRRSLEEQLTGEPSEDDPREKTTLRMRLPTGETLLRKFLAEEKILMVLVYLGSKGFSADQYKVLTTWPKRDLTSLDEQQTFKELRLCPQETLFIEER